MFSHLRCDIFGLASYTEHSDSLDMRAELSKADAPWADIARRVSRDMVLSYIYKCLSGSEGFKLLTKTLSDCNYGKITLCQIRNED